jgi:hypothetical protein
MRRLALPVLLVAAAGSGLVAWGSLSNLWAGYQDSPTSTYLLIGVPALAFCVAALLAAVGLWRDRRT